MEISGRRYDAKENTPLQKCLWRVLKTIRAARDKGWLHQDISSANIMIAEDEEDLRGDIQIAQQTGVNSVCGPRNKYRCDISLVG
jgi:RIO-like serine/threonine protein kinase